MICRAGEERPALEALLMRAPWHNVFHLSALSEFGLTSPGDVNGGTWAIGTFERGALVAAMVVLRGTGGIYHAPDDRESMEALAEAAHDAVVRGRLALAR